MRTLAATLIALSIISCTKPSGPVIDEVYLTRDENSEDDGQYNFITFSQDSVSLYYYLDNRLVTVPYVLTGDRLHVGEQAFAIEYDDEELIICWPQSATRAVPLHRKGKALSEANTNWIADRTYSVINEDFAVHLSKINNCGANRFSLIEYVNGQSNKVVMRHTNDVQAVGFGDYKLLLVGGLCSVILNEDEDGSIIYTGASGWGEKISGTLVPNERVPRRALEIKGNWTAESVSIEKLLSGEMGNSTMPDEMEIEMAPPPVMKGERDYSGHEHFILGPSVEYTVNAEAENGELTVLLNGRPVYFYRIYQSAIDDQYFLLSEDCDKVLPLSLSADHLEFRVKFSHVDYGINTHTVDMRFE